MVEAYQVPRAVPAEVVVQHVANPPPAVVPAVEPQPVEEAAEQVQSSEWGTISFFPSFSFWVCLVWCRKELNFSYLLLRSAYGGEISRVLFVACLSGAIFFSTLFFNYQWGWPERWNVFKKMSSKFAWSGEVFPRVNLSCKVFLPEWGCLKRRWILNWMAEEFVCKNFYLCDVAWSIAWILLWMAWDYVCENLFCPVCFLPEVASRIAWNWLKDGLVGLPVR